MGTSKRRTSTASEDHKEYWNQQHKDGFNLLRLRSAHNHKWAHHRILIPLLDQINPGSILEVGYGTLDDYYRIRDNGFVGPYHGVEITDQYLELGRKTEGIEVVRGDIENLPFEDDSFDVVYARGVVEMQSSYEKAITECLRVAARWAFLVFVGLSYGETKINRSERRGHVHYLNNYNLLDIIRFVKPRTCLVKHKRIYTSVVIDATPLD